MCFVKELFMIEYATMNRVNVMLFFIYFGPYVPCFINKPIKESKVYKYTNLKLEICKKYQLLVQANCPTKVTSEGIHTLTKQENIITETKGWQ